MRPEGWESRLDAAIEGARTEPFSWGTHDCCMFALNIACEILLTDPAPQFRGTYTTEFGAARALKEHGDGTVRGTVTQILDEEIPVRTAQRGDLVLLQQPDLGDTLGVCLGVDSAFVGLDGLHYAPTLDCACAWRIE